MEYCSLLRINQFSAQLHLIYFILLAVWFISVFQYQFQIYLFSYHLDIFIQSFLSLFFSHIFISKLLHIISIILNIARYFQDVLFRYSLFTFFHSNFLKICSLLFQLIFTRAFLQIVVHLFFLPLQLNLISDLIKHKYRESINLSIYLKIKVCLKKLVNIQNSDYFLL